MTETLGIFGGTFDPPHIGHQILAAEAQYQLGLDRVLWVLTPDPPHKQGQPITSPGIRFELTQAATRGSNLFEISRVEIDRQPPHYAFDTVCLLQEQYPDANLIYLMGGDSLHDLPTWYSAPEFVTACHALGVMRRPGDQVDLKTVEDLLPGIQAKIRFFESPLLEVAASEIRNRILHGQPFRYFLPPEVYRLVKKYRLYEREIKEPS